MAKDPAFETAPPQGVGYTPRADWYPDPEIPDYWRYWDGGAWTQERLPTPPNWSGGPQSTGARRGRRPWALVGIAAIAVVAVGFALIEVVAPPSRESPPCSDSAVAFLSAFERDSLPGLDVQETVGERPNDEGLCMLDYLVDSDLPAVQQELAAYLESLGYSVRVTPYAGEPEPGAEILDENLIAKIEASAPGKPDLEIQMGPESNPVGVELLLVDP